jgi:hypothetical protein
MAKVFAVMARVFVSEARDFVRTVNKLGHGAYAGRRRSHDDVILAVALAIWARGPSTVSQGVASRPPRQAILWPPT